MPRTTEDAVGGILELEEDVPAAPFIEVANALVTEVCAPVVTYDATRLELIERWLSAHFYSIREMIPSRESAGAVYEEFQHKVGLMLQNTMYGQQAMIIDTAGGLARLSKRMENGLGGLPGLFWLGVDSEESSS